MDGRSKKKYRIVSDLCYTYGFNLLFFDNNAFTYECFYGLKLNMRRCQSIAGAQHFRSKLYLDKMGFYIDDEIADALSLDSESKHYTSQLFQAMYEEAMRWQMEAERRGT